MKPSRRRTLQVKTTQCQCCKLADQRALRKGRDYCRSNRATISNGHCEDFQTSRFKRNKKQEKVEA